MRFRTADVFLARRALLVPDSEASGDEGDERCVASVELPADSTDNGELPCVGDGYDPELGARAPSSNDDPGATSGIGAEAGVVGKWA